MKDKVAVVTGGSGVLCSAMAEHLAQHGYKVAILSRSIEKGQRVADRITERGGTALALSVDVLNKEALQEAHRTILDQFGPCDLLINGAGGNHPGGTTSQSYFEPAQLEDESQSFFDLDFDGVKYVFDLNFLGTFLPSQIFGRDMVNRKGCQIINISSMSAYAPLTKISAYSAAKAAVSNFTQWLAVHFSKVGIRVNAIAPGFFITHQNRALLTNEDGSLTERGQAIIDHTPMGEFGKAEDLISTLDWLRDDRSSFITGVVVPVDGGFMAFHGV